ncbi:MAG: CRTAC1 family protein [Gemmataceae bacterium]
MINPLRTGADALPRRLRYCLLGGSLLVFAALASVFVYRQAASQPDPNDPSAAPTPSPPLVQGPPWFEDVTASSGVRFTYHNGEEADLYTILESLGGGVALLDYDGDGRLDIFLTGGGSFGGARNDRIHGRPSKLYRNLGNWKFQDVTKDVGLDAVSWWYTHGAAVADYDRDGWPDLLVTGYGRLALWHNEPNGKGGRHLVDVSQQLGLRDHSWSTSAGWADLDGDGYPDLYVCHYLDWSFDNDPLCKSKRPGVARDVCHPRHFKPLVDALYHNEKGRHFRDVSAEQGFRATGYGLGVVVADLNDDRRPDIYVANDASNNFLFLNRGEGKLEEASLRAGVAFNDAGHYMGSMGVDAGDYDGSGRPALWVTNFQGDLPALFRNLGREIFYYQSHAVGVAAIGQHLVGFGTGFLDADNDGWEDLVFVNGHVLRHPPGNTLKQRPVLFHNVERKGRRFFKDISARGGSFFQTPAVGRGLAIGDLDDDGWPDLVVSHSNSPVVLLRNQAARTCPAHWLGLRLVGRQNRDVVGSTVILEGRTRRLTRFVKGGGSYLSAGDSRILFGLGATEKVKSVTVKWSWGQTQSWDHLEPDDYWELREGETAARRIRGAAR